MHSSYIRADPPSFDLKPYAPRLSSMEAYLSIRAEASWVSEIVGDGMKVQATRHCL
jgi:hypothetical protein